MKTVRIKPGKAIQGKKPLRTWYKIVLCFRPYGFKDRPWCIVNEKQLPFIFKALSEEWDKTFF